MAPSLPTQLPRFGGDDDGTNLSLDHTTIYRWVLFHQGVREIMAYYDADPACQSINTVFDQILDRIITTYRRAWPN